MTITASDYSKHPQSVCGPGGRYQNNTISTAYDNIEWATGVVTKYNVSTQQATAFANVTTALYVSVRTDAAITIYLNADTNHAISVGASTEFTCSTLEITNIFITAAGTANVKLFMTGI